MELTENNFTVLPTVVYELQSLERLYLDNNFRLERIGAKIIELKSLEELSCSENSSLVYPPYAVCNQGLSAIKTYFESFSSLQETTKTEMPMRVVGNVFAGKTALVKSLQLGKRCLTYRSKDSPLDEATKVFKVKHLDLLKSRVNLFDCGGDTIYNIGWSFSYIEKCIPLIVVNMHEFKTLSGRRGLREATRNVCCRWISHLYLPCPHLGAPILVLTHKDMLNSDEFQQLREELLAMVQSIRMDDITEMPISSTSSNMSDSMHLWNSDLPLFDSKDIFEFSNDLNETSNIESLRETLRIRCEAFQTEVPPTWDLVSAYIKEQTASDYIPLSVLQSQFPNDDLRTILRFMHNFGRLFWFEKDPKLSQYIFHQHTLITGIISVLFDESSAELWKKSVATFDTPTHNTKRMTSTRYKHIVEQFSTSGLLDESLLTEILAQKFKIPVEVALQLLASFSILYGPIANRNSSAYIIPYLSSTYMGGAWKRDGQLQLRMEIILTGMAPPFYFYHLITVAVLKKASDNFSSAQVNKNGATIHRGQTATHFIHDYNTGKMTLQVSTAVNFLGDSWKHLLNLATVIVEQLSTTWKACHVEVLMYCAHCLFLRDVNPAYEVNPFWFSNICQSGDPETSLAVKLSLLGLEPVLCKNSAPNKKMIVPSALVLPCKLFSPIYCIDYFYF